MQTSLTYRSNRDLFSNHYLDEHLPETEDWEEVDDDAVRAARDEIIELWEREKDTVEERNESQLEEKFIRPMFRKLGIPFEVEESVSRGQRRPDYGFFESEDAARGAFDRRKEDGDFYEHAVAVADAKRWGRKLDTRGEHERDFENPSYQIHVYLQETPTQWAVLTNGKKWRLYYGPTSHRLDSYYEIDLPTVLENGDLDDFRHFYLFFRHEAFVEDASGDCFLDDVYSESNTFAEALGEDLQDNIYKAIRVLAEGFLDGNDDLDEGDLDLIHDSSLIYLYRLIFVLYAESEGRELLPTDNDIYSDAYSLNQLKQTVAENQDEPQDHYLAWKTDLWDRLDELFDLINEGSEAKDIPQDQLYIPAYNGGLFRTNPDESDSVEAQFLACHEIGDAYLAEVLDLLTRREAENGKGKIFVDYSSLDIRHLGSIYEGLLEYQLNIAEEALALDDGEYTSADENENVVVPEGDVYLTTDSGERKATGSYYTPEYVVEYIVENTLEPLVEDIRMDLAGQSAFDEGGFAEEFAQRVFDLKILDPAMGSGHFLTSAVDYLAREIIDAQEKQAAQQGIETVDEEHDINWARRKVAQRCIYGVDLNPLAVELAKVSLWLRTLAAEQPLAFLDHHLKTGNSLVGSDIDDVLENGDSPTEQGQLTLQQSFEYTRQQALEHVMDRFQDLLSIDNETLDDIKEMEEVYDEVRDDPLYQHLLAMANVHTAEEFELDVPGDAYERMAEALRDDSWEEIETQEWFRSAQAVADKRNFFHWELEFPVAFYGQDGDRLSDPGFDAIIGNPPWVITSDDELTEYLWKKYQFQSGQPDLYRFFIERCINLTGGKYSMITPSSWFSIPAAEDLRVEIIGGAHLTRASLVPQSAFGEVDANMSTFIIDMNDEVEDIGIYDLSDDGKATQLREIPYDTLESDSYRINLRSSVRERRIVSEMKDGSVSLGEISDRTVGYQLYHTDIHDQETIDEESYHSSEKESNSHVPEIRSSSLYKYYVDPEPDGYVDLSAEFFRIPPERFRKGDRILIREITGDDGITASNVSRELLFPKSVISLVLEDDRFSTGYITALLNSTLLSFEFLVTGEKATQDLFPRLSMSSLDRLTIRLPPTDNVLTPQDIEQSTEQEELVTLHRESPNTAKFLEQLVEDVRDFKEQKHLLNIDIADYLGEYSWGESLDELDASQPASGVSQTILAETTQTRKKLHIDDVEVDETGAKVTISVVARYKPENPENHNTDNYDYTTTGPIPAFELIGLSEQKKELVKEFVPHAVSQAGGFAEFRDNGTKRNSLVDRISALTLPQIDEVEQGLEQYINKKQQHDLLKRKIAERVKIIDRAVYELYDISEDEIQIIQNAVTND